MRPDSSEALGVLEKNRMSYIFLAPLPENKLDRRGRVNGHIYYKLDREGEEYLDGLAKRFAGDGVVAVYGADTSVKAVEYLARQIDTSKWVSRKLRGFNFGKFAGRAWDEVERVVADICKRWDDNQSVPIVGGDSWISYERRFLKNLLETISTPGSVSIVILVPHLDLGAFLAVAKHQEKPWEMLKAHDARYKVVKMKVKDVADNNTQEAGDVSGGSPERGDVSATVGVPDGDAGVVETTLSESEPTTSA